MLLMRLGTVADTKRIDRDEHKEEEDNDDDDDDGSGGVFLSQVKNIAR